MGFEPTTVGFGVQRSTVGATPSPMVFLTALSLSTQSLLNFAFINFFEENLHFYHKRYDYKTLSQSEYTLKKRRNVS